MSTLNLALEKISFLPPTRVTDDTSVLSLKNLVMEPLLRWNRGLAEPALLSSWTHADDGRRWRFTVRPGARFHDGRPFVAADVVSFVDGILGAVDTFGMKWSYARYLRNTRVWAPDDTTVEVVDPDPIADILDIFCEFYICRLDGDGQPVIGTGPYRVRTLRPGESATLERVRAGSGPDRIEVVADPSAEARLDRLKSGAVDVALNLERVDGRIEFDPRWRWGRCANTLSVMFYLNCSAGVFRSPDARLAANLAVDKDALIRDVFDGLAIPASTIVSPFHLGMADGALAPVPYAPDQARALLDGIGGGGRILLRTPTHMPERAPQISAHVAASLRDVGFTVDVETEHDRPEYARQVGAKRIGDLAIFDSSPQSTFRVLDDKVSSRSRAVWWQGYDDPQADDLIAAAGAAVSPGEREAAYARCLARLRANPPWLYLVHPVHVFAAAPAVGDVTIDPRGSLVIGHPGTA